MSANIRIGGREAYQVVQLTNQSNRHGLITGATGTGKTVALQVLAEGFHVQVYLSLPLTSKAI